MFTTEDTRTFGGIMDSVRSLGEKIGSMIHVKGSWVIKVVLMSFAVIIVGVSILVASIAKNTFGKK